MSREPTYPDDAPVGGAGGGAAPSRSKEEKKDGKRGTKLVAGAAIGIGSAAIVAALLYANRSKKTDK
jgi:hypothetical protein